MYNQIFNIAGLTILLNSDVEIKCDRQFLDFESNQDAGYKVFFRCVSQLKEFDFEPIAKDTGFNVYDTEYGIEKQFLTSSHIPYAISSWDWANKKINVDYLKNGLISINHSGGSFFHIGWEEILLREKRMILHACCIATSLGGILFSGDSGIGKSTQGDLWCKYEGANLINGDRPILYKQEDGWVAYGSPYAGSSECHRNAHVGIKAIVMLKQAKECSICRLSVAEAFQRIYAQLTIGAWNSENVISACDLVEQLVQDIPIYELSCTPDKEAVDILKETLLRGSGNE